MPGQADYWYLYDRLNRLTLTQGELVAVTANGATTNQILITKKQGASLAYDAAGNRRQALSMDSSGTTNTDLYSYDSDNRLTGVTRNGVLSSGRAYDGAGRVTELTSFVTTGSTAGAIDSRRVNTFNDNGWMQIQDSYKEAVIAGTSTYFGPGTTTSSYDVNGNLASVINTEQQWTGGEYGYYVQATTRTRNFTNDASGIILTKTDNAAITQQYYANDKSIGSVSGTPNNPSSTTADFDFNFTPVSDSYPAITPGNYTVANGDTLKGIAYRVYGDSKLWYLIADANGLSLDSSLSVGQSLKIPNRISNIHNDSETNRPYNASSIIGDLTPTLPDPPPVYSYGGGDGGGGGDCGGMGEIFTIAIVIVAAYFIGPEVFSALGGETAAATAALDAEAAGWAAAGGTEAEAAAAAAQAASSQAALQGVTALSQGLTYAGANLAGQVFGNVIGAQTGIDFGQVAMAGITAGIGSYAGSALGIGSIGNSFLGEAAGSALRNVLNQGGNILVGKQRRSKGSKDQRGRSRI